MDMQIISAIWRNSSARKTLLHAASRCHSLRCLQSAPRFVAHRFVAPHFDLPRANSLQSMTSVSDPAQSILTNVRTGVSSNKSINGRWSMVRYPALVVFPLLLSACAATGEGGAPGVSASSGTGDQSPFDAAMARESDVKKEQLLKLGDEHTLTLIGTVDDPPEYNEESDYWYFSSTYGLSLIHI